MSDTANFHQNLFCAIIMIMVLHFRIQIFFSQVLHKLAKFEGIVSQSQVDISVIGKLFVFNVSLQGTLREFLDFNQLPNL